MKFSELSALPFVHLYAGDLPDMPEYRSSQKVGLSLTQDDQWHIRHDVSLPLPIADESVDLYQSEDVFEHIVYEKIPATIREIYRVLKKGGLFRLSVPDYRCDILAERALRDSEGNFLFDPLGGGAYKRRFYSLEKNELSTAVMSGFQNMKTYLTYSKTYLFLQLNFSITMMKMGFPIQSPLITQKASYQEPLTTTTGFHLPSGPCP